MAKVQIGPEEFLTVPDNYGAEEVKRAVNEFKTWRASNPDVPAPSSNREPPPDPSDTDSWGTWAGKVAGSAVRGTGGGIMSLGDMGLNAVKSLVNTGKSMMSSSDDPEVAKSFMDTRSAPLRQGYENIVPAQPKGSTYENVAETSEVLGPAIVEAMATRGRSLFSPESLYKVPAIAARDTGLGIAGEEAGRAVGGEPGAFIGSIAAPTAIPSATRRAAHAMLTVPESADRLATIERINTRQPEKPIPLSLGLVGSKPASVMEDWVGGSSFLAPKIAQTRKGQFEALEHGVQTELEKARGAPAQGPITRTSIGAGMDMAIDAATKKADDTIHQIQQDLESRIGPLSTTNLQATNRRLLQISKDTSVNSKTRDNARDLMVTLGKDTTKVPMGTYTDPNTGMTYPISQRQGTYGATKDIRSDVGTDLSSTGERLKKQVTGPAYDELTDTMKETAETQGVPRQEFEDIQDTTTELYNDKAALKDLGRGKTEEGTWQRTVGGRSGPVKQLDPLMKHVPDETIEAMVDDLELRIRGVNAGQELNPKLFRTESIDAWRGLSQERKLVLTKNNPELIAAMDDIADVATLENTRAGQRTRPGKAGSTIGMGRIGLTGAVPFSAAAAGSAFGPLSLPALIAAAATVAPAVIGRMSTNPDLIRSIVNNTGPGLATVLARAIGGGAAGANIRSSPAEQDYKSEEDARYRKLYMGGQ